QALAPPGPREEAELHLGQAERRLGVVGRHAIGAGERELEPAAEAGPMDADDDGLGKRRHASQHLLPLRRQPLRLGGGRQGDEFLDVGAGDEVVRLAGEERDGAHGAIPCEPLERRVELVLDRLRDRVHRLAGGIERDHGDPVPDFPAERRHQRRSRTRANAIPPWAQMEISPNWTSRRRISFASVVTIRPPVAPNGCPMAIEPPITLMMESSISQPLAAQPWKLESTCEAKASWTSINPRSFH